MGCLSAKSYIVDTGLYPLSFGKACTLFVAGSMLARVYLILLEITPDYQRRFGQKVQRKCAKLLTANLFRDLIFKIQKATGGEEHQSLSGSDRAEINELLSDVEQEHALELCQ